MTDQEAAGQTTEKPKEEKRGEYPEVKLPAGYTPPDDPEIGDEWDATVRLRVKGKGQYCLVTIDGVPFAEKDDDEEAERAAAPSMRDAVSAQRDAGYGYTM